MVADLRQFIPGPAVDLAGYANLLASV